MTKPLQILVPLAAPSPFFDPAEFFFPKPLVDVGGKSMIEYTLSALQATVENARFFFLVRQEDIAKFSIDSILRLRAASVRTAETRPGVPLLAGLAKTTKTNASPLS